MRFQSTHRSLENWACGLSTFMLVASLASSSVMAQRPTRSTPSEPAVGGLTLEEFADHQAILLAELTALIPDGTLDTPVRAPISQQNRDDLKGKGPNGNGPLRVGVVKAVNGVEVVRGQAFKRGTIVDNADGSFVWAMSVASIDAQAIRVQLKNFSLPEGAEMYFFGIGTIVDGPYKGVGRNGNGEFWTRSIASEKGVILIRSIGSMSDEQRREISFIVKGVGHIRGRPPQSVEQNHDSWPCADNAACVVDVNCVNTGPAAPAETAVAKLEWISGQFINTCTGGLLADTDPGTQIPYFLTANHCFSSSSANMESFFFYTTDSCNGGCPDNLVSGGTPPPASTVGVTVMATGSAGDFTLARLNQAPPAGATYLGWTNAPIANSHGASLYRVSNANFGPQVYSQHDVDANAGTCTGWPRGQRIYSADQTGATMGGSSGSPVLNSNSEVVGQLSGCCGFNCADECDAASNSTVDGALAFYWSSVAEFLDPPAGCTTNAECDDGQFCTGSETCSGGSCQSSGNPCSPGDTCNESTNACDPPVCDNDGACEAGEDCNNCSGDCRQKTGGKPSSRYCCDGDLADCGDTRCNESGWICGGGSGGCSTNGECDDALFCNGAETCSGGACQSGSDPCPGQGCDESTDLCVSCSGNKDLCSSNSDCCSNNCKGGRCKGN